MSTLGQVWEVVAMLTIPAAGIGAGLFKNRFIRSSDKAARQRLMPKLSAHIR